MVRYTHPTSSAFMRILSSSKFDQELIVFVRFLRRRRYIQKPRVSDALRRATLGEVNRFSIFEPQRGSIVVRIRS